MSSYDFGYSAFLTRSHLILFVVFALLAVIAWRRGWRSWITGALAIVALYGLAGTTSCTWCSASTSLASCRHRSSCLPDRGECSISAPDRPGDAHVALARPNAKVTGLDMYKGYFGIEDNTPDRLLANARAAGVADRVDAKVGDMRDLPFESGTFDAALSAFAIDHLPRKDIPVALNEAARVLKAHGQFLYLGLNSDAYIRFVSRRCMDTAGGIGPRCRTSGARCWAARAST